jgi:hypothetical protein
MGVGLGGGVMVIKGGVLRRECATLMEHIVNWTFVGSDPVR